MKNKARIYLICFATFVFSVYVQAAEVKLLHIINPASSYGVQIGSVLNREFKIAVDAPYELMTSSLPLKGENRNGIELRQLSVSHVKSSGKRVYHIVISYQIFASAHKPVLMALPEERIALSGGKEPLSINLPAWKFWYSPLVAEHIVKAQSELQPQLKPSLFNLNAHYVGIGLSLASLVLGLLGLIYVYADKYWLPNMNGAFAVAHRKIKQLKPGKQSHMDALMLVHQAFNQTYGANLFATDVDQFLERHINFSKLQVEIHRFFELSNLMLFSGRPDEHKNDVNALAVLSRRLRDCERGV